MQEMDLNGDPIECLCACKVREEMHVLAKLCEEEKIDREQGREMN